MPWIAGMKDYYTGFHGKRARKRIETIDAVTWAKDKLDFEADARKRKFSQRAPNEASSTARANEASPRHRPSKPCIMRTRTASSSSPARAFAKARIFSKRRNRPVAQLGIRVATMA
jgi:hypothetical protein